MNSPHLEGVGEVVGSAKLGPTLTGGTGSGGMGGGGSGVGCGPSTESEEEVGSFCVVDGRLTGRTARFGSIEPPLVACL